MKSDVVAQNVNMGRYARYSSGQSCGGCDLRFNVSLFLPRKCGLCRDMMSVCLSVRLSDADIVTKRLNTLSNFFHIQVFLITNRYGNTPTMTY